MEQNKIQYVLGVLRLVMGWIFLWAFMDKLFGLGFATNPEKAWILGGSPTSGFLSFGVHGPFVDLYNSLAGIPFIDWLYMLGMLFIGFTLMSGVLVRLGSIAGIMMLFLLYTAVGLFPANNPFIDEHIVYMLL